MDQLGELHTPPVGQKRGEEEGNEIPNSREDPEEFEDYVTSTSYVKGM